MTETATRKAGCAGARAHLSRAIYVRGGSGDYCMTCDRFLDSDETVVF